LVRPVLRNGTCGGAAGYRRKQLKPPLLLYLAHGQDLHRCAVGPALAAAAERAGWAFDVYYDSRRSGRHFGGPDAGGGSDAVATGSLVAGGRHLDHTLWLTTSYQVAAVGDPGSPIWPAIKAGGEVIRRTADPAEIFSAALSRLGTPAPTEVMVLDAGQQTALRIVTAPFLYPRILLANCLGVDVTCDSGLRDRLERLGARRFIGLFIDPDRASAFPGGLDAVEGDVVGETYATLTDRLARQHAAWARGTLLGDPDLVAAQLGLAVRRRLIPLYGRPQTDIIERAAELIRTSDDPVYGRQFDDHDFFALGRLGRGLQIVDPDPPFACAASVPAALSCPPKPIRHLEPDDETLRAWAEEGRVLATLVLWAGMIRELHCIPRIIDLVAATGLRCGLVITIDTLAKASPSDLSLLAVPEERGGVFGRVELLLGSTGRGVCAEACMPDGELARLLSNARSELANSLPEGLMPRGWWPLMDAKLISATAPLVSWEGWRPVVRIPPRPRHKERPSAEEPAPCDRLDARRIMGSALRRYRLDRIYEVWRPYDHARPGPFDPAVVEAVRCAGFEYMWTKTAFRRPHSALVMNGFVALPFTAGDWDGWSPFYTVRSTAQVRTAERRLLRARRPAWLASNVDSILWMLPAEVLEKGRALFQVAQLVANGGCTGRLVNVTPNVIARYARILATGKTISRPFSFDWPGFSKV
jgi:hypothetical protein